MNKSKLNSYRARAHWANAEYLKAQCIAYREAASNADAIGETETADQWRNRATDLEQKAFYEYQEARDLGYYGDGESVTGSGD